MLTQRDVFKNLSDTELWMPKYALSIYLKFFFIPFYWWYFISRSKFKKKILPIFLLNETYFVYYKEKLFNCPRDIFFLI